MPHFVFIVNPVAGKGQHAAALCDRIEKHFAGRTQDYEIYRTCGPRDAFRFVQSYPTGNDGTQICFVACGGDGTLHEVVNGAAGLLIGPRMQNSSERV